MIDKNDPRLTEFVLGELDAERQAEIQSQLDTDPELASAVNELRQTIALISNSFQSEPGLALSEQQKSELAQVPTGLPQTKSAGANGHKPIDSQTSGLRNNKFGWVVLAASLCGLMLAGSIWYANQNPAIQFAGVTAENASVVASKKSANEVLPNKIETKDYVELHDLVTQTVENDAWKESDKQKSELGAFIPNLSPTVSQEQEQEQQVADWEGRLNLNRSPSLEKGASSLDSAGRFSQLGRSPGGQGGNSNGLGMSDPARIDSYSFDGSTTTQPSSGLVLDELLTRPYDAPDMKKAFMGEADGIAPSADSPTEYLSGGEVPLSLESLATHNRRTEELGVALNGRRGEAIGNDTALTQLNSIPVGRASRDFLGELVQMESKNSPVDEESEAGSDDLSLAISPEVSRELAESLVRRIDPMGTKEIRLSEALQGSADAKIEIVDDSIGIITLKSDAEDLEVVREKVRQLAGENGIAEGDQGKIQWRDQVQQVLDQRNKQIRKANTWKRVKATPNSSRLMIGEDDELPLNGMQVNVQIDGFRARVLIDCFYYNDREQQLEGNFKLRLPDDASLYYFAFGESAYEYDPLLDWANSDWPKQEFQNDETEFVSLQPDDIRQQRADTWKNCKEARMVPREKAAFAYNQTVRRKIDPALVEWSGAGVFNARVFPLTPKKMHRIVMGYDVNLVRAGNGWTFDLDLPEQAGKCQVDLNVQETESVNVTVESAGESVKKTPGKNVDQTPASFSRYRLSNPKAKSIHVSIDQSAEIVLTDSNEKQGDFWGLQLTPELPVDAVSGNSKAIFLLDTSLSSNPDKFNVWLKLLRSTLENNRDSLTHFNVLFFDVGSAFWRDGFVNNTPENTEALLNDCQQITLEGATDLYGAVEKIANAKWATANESEPDLFLFSDGAANWGETNLRLIQRQLEEHKFGNLFAYQTGLTGTAIANLRFLANQSGGAVFSVATEDEIKTASMAHRNRPWKLVSIEAAGTQDVMTAGRVEWVYPGQALTIVGRGTPTGDVQMKLTQADQTKTVSVHPQQIKSELASSLYGQIAVGQLESLGTQVFDISAAYARHFRVTGETCSLLMLETDAEYEQFGIKPEEDLFVIKSKNAGRLVEETLRQFAAEIADPKLQMLAWLKRLETMPGMEFQIPTALQLALDGIQFEAISQPLDCAPRNAQSAPEAYLKELANEALNYDVIETEAQRRAAKSVDEAIKVWSCLVERNPGDLVIARDVAFTAIELDRPALAYPLLLAVAKARPYEASVYPALGQCLSRLKKADMAIVFYEIALAANFQNRDEDFRRIVAADYLHLLRQVTKGELKTSVPDFVAARRETLQTTLGFETADLLITMMWNTDQTDVDLHVLEPSGQECSYELKDTRIGGHITQDITTGFGPEMYSLADAMKGKYEVFVKLFGNDQNRTSLHNKIHLTIYKGYGKPEERITRKTIVLKTVGEKEAVGTIGVD